MIKRATWFLAAGAALLVLMLAAVAFAWWHQRQDAAREAILRDAQAATVLAQTERDSALGESRRIDSVARVRAEERDTARAYSDRLEARLSAAQHNQPTGTFEGVPAGSEPEGITWREAYFIADSGWISTKAALYAEQQRSKLFEDDRDHWKGVSSDQAIAIVRLNTAVAVALKKNDCHILWVINCPSRKASAIGGAIVGAGGVLAAWHPWSRSQRPQAGSQPQTRGASVRF
jgi:hypothetical protein